MAEPGKIGVVTATLMVAGDIMGSDSKQTVWAFIIALLTTLFYMRNLNRRAAATEAASAVAREERQDVLP